MNGVLKIRSYIRRHYVDASCNLSAAFITTWNSTVPEWHVIIQLGMFFDYRSDCVMNTMELWTTYLVSRIQVADVDALGAAIHWRYYGKFRCINISTRHIHYSALMCNIWKQNITLTSHLKYFFKQCPALAHKNVCIVWGAQLKCFRTNSSKRLIGIHLFIFETLSWGSCKGQKQIASLSPQPKQEIKLTSASNTNADKYIHRQHRSIRLNGLWTLTDVYKKKLTNAEIAQAWRDHIIIL